MTMKRPNENEQTYLPLI